EPEERREARLPDAVRHRGPADPALHEPWRTGVRSVRRARHRAAAGAAPGPPRSGRRTQPRLLLRLREVPAGEGTREGHALAVRHPAQRGQGRMKQAQLIPKRRKRQPTADTMREQLRLAADEIIRLRTERDWMNRHMVAGAWRFPI